MSDKPSVLTVLERSQEWASIRDQVAQGRAPQTLAVVIPSEDARDLAFIYGRLLLCESLSACGSCASCRAWMDDGHPDMIFAGPGDRAPKMREPKSGVREIDAFQAAIALKPAIARRRLGVFPFADRASVDASNAMLKTAEEPPAGVHILFTASEDRFLPTIRSRARVFIAPAASAASPVRPPEGPREWAAWLERTKGMKTSQLEPEIGAWAEWFASQGDARKAADLKNFIYLSGSGGRNMSAAMVQDAAHAILREGARFEQLFGDVRQA